MHRWQSGLRQSGVTVHGLLLALVALCTTSTLMADPQIIREGSRLSIHWTSDVRGIWELVDDRGHLCASGRVSYGANSVELAKVASPNDLRFRIREQDGGGSITFPVLGERVQSPLVKPESGAVIYQLPPRTFLARGMGAEQTGRLADLTTERLQEIRDLGVDYLWLTGVLEHASRAQTDPDVVKGEAGSYYAIYDNWDVSSQIGTLGDFEALIERAHTVGLRILIDFVANHTARVHRTDVVCKQHMDFGRNDRAEEFFRPENNFFYIMGASFVPPPQSDSSGADGIFDTDIFSPGIQLETPAKVTGNNVLSATPSYGDWFETVKLNYGWDFVHQRAFYEPRPRTWEQMLDVARYWVEKGVDGFRVDFAHAVPVEFWRYFATELRRTNPNVFLLAEAYERDHAMRAPGFSYQAILEAGFDSVYNSEMYWPMRSQAARTGDMRAAVPSRAPAFAPSIVERGFMFTHYMENHDEHRLASREFATMIGDRHRRAEIGLAYTAYLGLLPGHLMLHGGQELQEDASVSIGHNDGRTSIFDFVFQPQSRAWNYGPRQRWMIEFRERYRDLLSLKNSEPFAAAHSAAAPSFIDLDPVNGYKDQSRGISAYLRFRGGEAYLVVANGDPLVEHEATIHFTGHEGQDTLGALAALGVESGEQRYIFREVFARRGWVPQDPAIAGQGVPGWVLYRPGNVPSGLYLGKVPAGTTYVFKVESVQSPTSH